jgi:hypothetical protein
LKGDPERPSSAGFANLRPEVLVKGKFILEITSYSIRRMPIMATRLCWVTFDPVTDNHALHPGLEIEIDDNNFREFISRW